MRSLARLRPSPAMVVALIALFVSIGGVGYAAAKIGSKQIKNNSIKSTDIKNMTIARKDISSKALESLKGSEAATGATGPQGPRGATGATGSAGSARAYGTVTSAGNVIAALSKGITVTKATSEGLGFYCVKAPGISPAAHPIIATADLNEGSGFTHLAQFVSSSQCGNQGGWLINTKSESGGVFADTDVRFSVVIP